MGPKGSATQDTWGAFVSAFDEAQMNIMKRARIGYLWPLFEMFKDRNQKHAEVIAEWLDPLVKKALEDSKTIDTMTSPLGDKTFLQHLVDSTQGQSHLFFFSLKWISKKFCSADPILIRDQLLSMLLASRDTVNLKLRTRWF
jgi:type II secretory pathway predicted ATPase ExeA